MTCDLTPKEDRHVSPGGRVFYTTLERPLSTHHSTPEDETWSILYEGEPAGKLYRGDTYGHTSSGLPRWHASTRGLYWRHASAIFVAHIGFDVAAFDSAEEAMEAWLQSADQILDCWDRKPVLRCVQRGGPQ